jgi:mannan endo-1,4-beta-mannosidase
MRSALGKTAAMILPVVLAGSVVMTLGNEHVALTSPAVRHVSVAPACGTVPAHKPYRGVTTDNPWKVNTARYEKATGVKVNLIAFYQAFGAALDTAKICDAAKRGALSLIQWNPRHTSLSSIANGQDDEYLKAYALAVRKLPVKLALSFAHEPNGQWFSWGYGHIRPATYVRAWRHVVNVFRNVGASNVRFVWTINRAIKGEEPIRKLWPGKDYVSWVGIDAYYWTRHAQFRDVIGHTVSVLHAFTHKPILIAETAAAGSSRDGQIVGLLRGIKLTTGILGYVWFNIDKRETWQVPDTTATRKAFRVSQTRNEAKQR